MRWADERGEGLFSDASREARVPANQLLRPIPAIDDEALEVMLPAFEVSGSSSPGQFGGWNKLGPDLCHAASLMPSGIPWWFRAEFCCRAPSAECGRSVLSYSIHRPIPVRASRSVAWKQRASPGSSVRSGTRSSNPSPRKRMNDSRSRTRYSRPARPMDRTAPCPLAADCPWSGPCAPAPRPEHLEIHRRQQTLERITALARLRAAVLTIGQPGLPTMPRPHRPSTQGNHGNADSAIVSRGVQSASARPHPPAA